MDTLKLTDKEYNEATKEWDYYNSPQKSDSKLS